MTTLTISACSSPGRVRHDNEDVALLNGRLLRDDSLFLTADVERDGRYVVAVCDGVGGHNAGEVASAHAAAHLASGVVALPSGLDSEQLADEMEHWREMEHHLLNDISRHDQHCEGMGTTLVSILFYEGIVAWLNCGDSRLYRMRDGILTCLTTDHSLYAVTHNPDDRHIITNCLGTGEGCRSYIDFRDMTRHVIDGDTFLLCSDGLTDMLTDDDIETCLSAGVDAPGLVRAACEAGGQDNVTALLVTVAHHT